MPSHKADDPGRAFLTAYWENIRAITSSYAGPMCKANRWDVEELISDVYIRCAEKQQGEGRYDPAKGTIGAYIWMQAFTVVRDKAREDSALKRVAVEVQYDEPTQLPDDRGIDDDELDQLRELVHDVRHTMSTQGHTERCVELIVDYFQVGPEALAEHHEFDELELLQFLQNLLSKLEAKGKLEHRKMWGRHRSVVRRRIHRLRASRRAVS